MMMGQLCQKVLWPGCKFCDLALTIGEKKRALYNNDSVTNDSAYDSLLSYFFFFYLGLFGVISILYNTYMTSFLSKRDITTQKMKVGKVQSWLFLEVADKDSQVFAKGLNVSVVSHIVLFSLL